MSIMLALASSSRPCPARRGRSRPGEAVPRPTSGEDGPAARHRPQGCRRPTLCAHGGAAASHEGQFGRGPSSTFGEGPLRSGGLRHQARCLWAHAAPGHGAGPRAWTAPALRNRAAPDAGRCRGGRGGQVSAPIRRFRNGPISWSRPGVPVVSMIVGGPARSILDRDRLVAATEPRAQRSRRGAPPTWCPVGGMSERVWDARGRRHHLAVQGGCRRPRRAGTQSDRVGLRPAPPHFSYSLHNRGVGFAPKPGHPAEVAPGLGGLHRTPSPPRS